MKKIVLFTCALAFAVGSLAAFTPADANSKSCNYTSGDKKKGYRC